MSGYQKIFEESLGHFIETIILLLVLLWSLLVLYISFTDDYILFDMILPAGISVVLVVLTIFAFLSRKFGQLEGEDRSTQIEALEDIDVLQNQDGIEESEPLMSVAPSIFLMVSILLFMALFGFYVGVGLFITLYFYRTKFSLPRSIVVGALSTITVYGVFEHALFLNLSSMRGLIF